MLQSLVAAIALVAAPIPPDEARGRADRLLADLVAIPSVDGTLGAQPVAERLAREFLQAGFPPADVQILPYRGTAALMVCLRAQRPRRGAILLLGHMDVVEARRADWSRDPFTLTRDGAYLYGRGTADMKGGLVAQAIALMRLRADHVPIDRDIVLFATGDEETAGDGAARIVGEWRPLHEAVLALNADAGGGAVDRGGRSLGFRLQTAEKTYASFTVTARYRGGHSSKPRADNAIYALADALQRLAAYRFAPAINETTRAYFERSARLRAHALGAAMGAFAADPRNRNAADMIEANEGEIGTTRTTCVPTLLSDGHAENALPQIATVTVNCRIFPGEPVARVRETLVRVVGSGVTVTLLDQFGDGTAPSPLTREVVDAYAEAVHARHAGVPIIPEMVAGATDGGRLREAGIPTYGVDGRGASDLAICARMVPTNGFWSRPSTRISITGTTCSSALQPAAAKH